MSSILLHDEVGTLATQLEELKKAHDKLRKDFDIASKESAEAFFGCIDKLNELEKKSKSIKKESPLPTYGLTNADPTVGMKNPWVPYSISSGGTSLNNETMTAKLDCIEKKLDSLLEIPVAEEVGSLQWHGDDNILYAQTSEGPIKIIHSIQNIWVEKNSGQRWTSPAQSNAKTDKICEYYASIKIWSTDKQCWIHFVKKLYWINNVDDYLCYKKPGFSGKGSTEEESRHIVYEELKKIADFSFAPTTK